MIRQMRWKEIKNGLRQWPLMARIWPLLRRAKAKLVKPHPKPLYDLVLQQNGLQPLDKRALLSYITHPFSISRDDPGFLRHINIWRAWELVRILNELGYVVDVVDYRDVSFVPCRSYDLFIGHGGINFEKIAQRLSDSTRKIYLSTGCYWKFWNERELARLAALRERRGLNLAPDRLIKNSEDAALLAADGVIGIGNDFTRRTYASFSPVIMTNNTALCDHYYESHVKDFEKGRQHFLYFAGGGSVHKGLDLLLEAFVGLEQHLWICCTIEEPFVETYSDALHNRSNIHLVGWTQPRSAKFYELMNTCNYVILPSCSEGQPHSVVECMNQGLVPVVTRACGLDVDGYGMLLDPCTIQEIARVVSVLSSYPAARCREMSLRARNAAVTDFSESAFRREMTKAIRQMATPGAFVRCEEMNSAHGPEN